MRLRRYKSSYYQFSYHRCYANRRKCLSMNSQLQQVHQGTKYSQLQKKKRKEVLSFLNQNTLQHVTIITLVPRILVKVKSLPIWLNVKRSYLFCFTKCNRWTSWSCKERNFIEAFPFFWNQNNIVTVITTRIYMNPKRAITCTMLKATISKQIKTKVATRQSPKVIKIYIIIMSWESIEVLLTKT